ncbi:MAG TPA: hypothetical protein VL096_13625 [Pirellulaceae bacterium]|nr:hypothetical protein [Pirellulaceae bacterium]
MDNPQTPNPYEAPPIKSDGRSMLSAGQIFVLLILGLLTIPAGAIAFFATCLGAVSVWDGRDMSFGFEVGLIGGSCVGIGTIVAMIYGVGRLRDYWKQRADRS